MSRLCTVCRSDAHYAIDDDLLKGQMTMKAISIKYAIHWNILTRHKKKCLANSMIAAKIGRGEASTDALLAYVRKVFEKLDSRIQATGDKAASNSELAALASAGIRSIDSAAKLLQHPGFVPQSNAVAQQGDVSQVRVIIMPTLQMGRPQVSLPEPIEVEAIEVPRDA